MLSFRFSMILLLLVKYDFKLNILDILKLNLPEYVKKLLLSIIIIIIYCLLTMYDFLCILGLKTFIYILIMFENCDTNYFVSKRGHSLK